MDGLRCEQLLPEVEYGQGAGLHIRTAAATEPLRSGWPLPDDNNGIENAIRPLALGRKNYLFAGNHDAVVRAAIVYSLLSSCKAVGVETRAWLEDVLKRLPSEKDPDDLLPSNWAVTNRQ